MTVVGLARSSLVVGVAMLGWLVVAPAAQAASSITVDLNFPAAVDVGQTNVPASLRITATGDTPPAPLPPSSTNYMGVCNAPGDSQGCGEIGSPWDSGILLTPSCAQAPAATMTVPICQAPNPGVIAVSPTATGSGSGCAGATFDVTMFNAALGMVKFTPRPAGTRLHLGPSGSSCLISFTFDVLKAPADASAGTTGLQTRAIATAGAEYNVPDVAFPHYKPEPARDLDNNVMNVTPVCAPPSTGTPPNCVPPPVCTPPLVGTPPNCRPPCEPPTTGTPPNCVPPPACTPPTTGTPPNCVPPPACTPPTTGTPPNCVPPPVCTPPATGTPPNCVTPPVCEPPSTGTPPDCASPPVCEPPSTGTPPNCVPPRNNVGSDVIVDPTLIGSPRCATGPAPIRRATLLGRPADRPFNVTVKVQGDRTAFKSVEFFLNNRKVKTLTKPTGVGRYTYRVVPSTLRRGSYRITARVTLVSSGDFTFTSGTVDLVRRISLPNIRFVPLASCRPARTTG